MLFNLPGVMVHSRAGGRVMLDNLSKQIRECLRHAEYCAREAKTTSNADLRDDYLILERRWLFLARSYELTEGSNRDAIGELLDA